MAKKSRRVSAAKSAAATLDQIEGRGLDFFGVVAQTQLRARMDYLVGKGFSSEQVLRRLTAEQGFDPDRYDLSFPRLAHAVAVTELSRVPHSRILLPGAGVLDEIARRAQELSPPEMVAAHNRFRPNKPTFLLFDKPQKVSSTSGVTWSVGGLRWGSFNAEHPILDSGAHEVRFGPAVPLSIYKYVKLDGAPVSSSNPSVLAPMVTGVIPLADPKSEIVKELEEPVSSTSGKLPLRNGKGEWLDYDGFFFRRWIAAIWQLEAEHPDAISPITRAQVPEIGDREVVMLKRPTSSPIQGSIVEAQSPILEGQSLSPKAWTATGALDELESIVERIVASYTDEKQRVRVRRDLRQLLSKTVHTARQSLPEEAVRKIVLNLFGYDDKAKWASPREIVDGFMVDEAKRLDNVALLPVGPLELDFLLNTAGEVLDGSPPSLSIKDLPYDKGLMYLPEELVLKTHAGLRGLRAVRWEPATVRSGEDQVPGLRLTLYSQVPSAVKQSVKGADSDGPPGLSRMEAAFIPLDRKLPGLVDQRFLSTRAPGENADQISDILPPDASNRVISDPGYTLPGRLLVATAYSLKNGKLGTKRLSQEPPREQSQQTPRQRRRTRRILYLPTAEPSSSENAQPRPIVGRDPLVSYTGACRLHRHNKPSITWVRDEHLRFLVSSTDPVQREVEREKLRRPYLDPKTGEVSVDIFFEKNPDLREFRIRKEDVGRPTPRAMTGRSRAVNARQSNQGDDSLSTQVVSAKKPADAPPASKVGQPPVTPKGFENQSPGSGSASNRRQLT